MKTLLIDNYDSFTYNLFQLLAEVNGEPPEVVRNDELPWPALARSGFDNVVISPGPGRPERSEDFGVCAEAIAAAEVPLLGVCLGHQGIGWAHGARVVRAPEVVHGRADVVRHDGSPLFAGIPRELRAVRYHSLCLEPPLPDALEALAWTADGVLMALAHRTRPLWGVQFHPESVASEHGRRLLANFRDLTAAHAGARRSAARPAAPRARPKPAREGGRTRARVLAARVDTALDPEAAFVALYGDCSHAFWLDSARAGAGARFSFMGAPEGPRSAVVSYDVGARELTLERAGAREVRAQTILDYLAAEGRTELEPHELPFDFDGGHVGYLGYEVKADCGGELVNESPLPDAAFMAVDRFVAFDRRERCAYAVAVAAPGEVAGAERWVAETAARVGRLPREPVAPPRPAADVGGGAPEARRSRSGYLDDVERCRELLAAGESYEICLTNRFETELDDDPLTVYRRLRRVNPAPFAAYLRLGDVAVLSSSPERFLRIERDGRVEAKPIKGTAPRGDTPVEDAWIAERLRASAKDRSENLMIADLLRNDLGSVCEIGSVTVPKLMDVESYETVHQLVTTVTGRLRAELGAPDCIRACFPPGSMTGAPKLRTMQILDRLEPGPRGVYSGAIGYLGLGGACDLSVAIRTIVLADGAASVGAGGAIVAASDADAEHREMLLKAEAALRALTPAGAASASAPSPASAAAGGN